MINLFPTLKRRAIFGKSLWDCVLFSVIFILFSAAGATAETTNTLSDVEIQGRQLAQELYWARPETNLTQTGILKIRDGKGIITNISVCFKTFATNGYWRASYIGGQDSLIITHQSGQANRYSFYRSLVDEQKPTQEMFSHVTLRENQTMMPFANSDFWLCDLGLEFFHWPAQKVLPNPTNLKRGREYTLLESTNPNPSTNGYSRVLSCIDKETGGILEAEAYDAKGDLLKVFEPKSFKKVNGQWELQEMQIRNVQTGSRTRLEFDLKK
jgi:Outer membrane lipoprotein-sorting protein